jgi:hypothetical protein
MTVSTPFLLSRIYASGWSAGRNCNVDDVDTIADLANSLNPHQTPAEHERWSRGFLDAVNHGGGTPVTFRHGHSTNGDKHGKRSEAQRSGAQEAEDGRKED